MTGAAPITGDRVILRPWADADAGFLVRACNDAEINNYLSGLPNPYTADDARWWISEGSRGDHKVALAITDRDSGAPLGGIGLGRFVPIRDQAEIGYWVAPWARCRGIATAAAATLTGWAFAERGLHRIELTARVDNPASQRVALGAGFTREGVRRAANISRDGARHDLVAFVRLATDPAGPAHRMLPDFPDGRLTDETVTIRPLGPADTADYLALHQLPEVVEVSIGPSFTPEAAAAFCARVQSEWLAGNRADCVVTDAGGAFAGHIGLFYQENQTSQAMIGYSLRPEFRGKGFMTRAANLLTEWAFTEAGIVRMIAGTNPQNVASQRVLERAGFVREAYLKARLPGPDGTRIDDVQFVRINPEYS